MNRLWSDSLGFAGEKVSFSVSGLHEKYQKASLNGKDVSSVLSGKSSDFTFPGLKKRFRLPEETRQSAIEQFA